MAYVEDKVLRLRSVLERMAVLLDEHEEAHWAAWARRCAETIDLRDPDSFKDPDSFRRVIGAYGGMGSLSDVMLWPPPSGKAAADYPPSTEFDRLRSEAYRLAAQTLADLCRGSRYRLSMTREEKG